MSANADALLLFAKRVHEIKDIPFCTSSSILWYLLNYNAVKEKKRTLTDYPLILIYQFQNLPLCSSIGCPIQAKMYNLCYYTTQKISVKQMLVLRWFYAGSTWQNFRLFFTIFDKYKNIRKPPKILDFRGFLILF